MEVLKEQFLLNGGDDNWLTYGICKAHPKLQSLSLINELMAYRPWSLNDKEIAKAVQGSANSSGKWSVPELLHAGAILACYHGLCGLV